MDNLVASSSPRAWLASSQRWPVSARGVLPLGHGALAVGEMAVGISSREASPILVSSGALTWNDVSTSLEKSHSLGGGGVSMTMRLSLFGVEFLDACLDVSNTTWDRESLTSMVMLTSPSGIGGGSLMRLSIRIGEE